MELFLNFYAKTVDKIFTYWNFKEVISFAITIPFELKYKVTKDNVY